MDAVNEAACGTLVGIPPALVKPGIYRLRFRDWATVNYFQRQPKVVCHFEICSEGTYFGTRIDRWYNVQALVGGPRRRGRFKVSWHQDLAREYLSMDQSVRRKDGIALSKLLPLLLEGEVATVTTCRRQRPLHAGLHYSVLRHVRLCSDVAQQP